MFCGLKPLLFKTLVCLDIIVIVYFIVVNSFKFILNRFAYKAPICNRFYLKTLYKTVRSSYSK